MAMVGSGGITIGVRKRLKIIPQKNWGGRASKKGDRTGRPKQGGGKEKHGHTYCQNRKKQLLASWPNKDKVPESGRRKKFEEEKCKKKKKKKKKKADGVITARTGLQIWSGKKTWGTLVGSWTKFQEVWCTSGQRGKQGTIQS